MTVSFLYIFAAVIPPVTRLVACSSLCPCLWHADWCLQSDWCFRYGTDVKYGIVLGQLLNRVLNVEQDEDDSTSPGIRVGIVAGGVVGTLLIVTVLTLVVSKYRAQRGGTGRLGAELRT